MELSDFITATLLEIMKGVSAASHQHRPEVHGGYINPTRKSRSADFEALPVRGVEFDVAVTVESSETSSKSGGIAIRVIEADLSADKSKRVTGESRVKFSVPVSMPSTDLLHM
ncbi:MAG TPA: hypothetical protein VMS43_00630 [Allosphingosinicella sp.]|nr:hypothetical protein [Allosphingosinicella sp.]